MKQVAAFILAVLVILQLSITVPCTASETTISSKSSDVCNPGPLGPSLAEMCHTSRFVVFMTLLDELTRVNDKISGICERVKPIEVPDEDYDFVVIGGGGGGAVVAGRLSEHHKFKVLVLEAGFDEPVGSQIPLFVDNLIGTRIDWNYTAANESHACLNDNGRCSISAGKMLGGGTAHYGMLYIRGNPTDYNNWAALGNEGWTWDEVKQYFLKAENNGQIEKFGRFYHATGGPLPVQQFPYVAPFGYAILEASKQAGYGVSEDLNGRDITGFAIAQTTNEAGVRRSSASSYLWPARNRENLHVSLGSHVTRIIVEEGRAVGVEYIKDGKLKTVWVSKEVVLSAGAVASPKILLLSGIGPEKHLEEMGIDVVKKLDGVGENLHDHITQVLYFSINDTDYYDNDHAIAAEYLANRTGPLSCNGLAQVMATLKTIEASPDYPDLQVYFNGYASACAPGNIRALHSSGLRELNVRAVNLRPRSKGKISLASLDPLVQPHIWVNYLSDPRDVEGVVQAVNLASALQDTEAMLAYNLTLTSEPEEACLNYTFLSNEYWQCAVHQGQVPELHLVGSCKMGNASDPMAVVDSRLRVYGIKGLRVADASIMPQVTSGNTGAPTMMIGELAADFIKQDHVC